MKAEEIEFELQRETSGMASSFESQREEAPQLYGVRTSHGDSAGGQVKVLGWPSCPTSAFASRGII